MYSECQRLSGSWYPINIPKSIRGHVWETETSILVAVKVWKKNQRGKQTNITGWMITLEPTSLYEIKFKLSDEPGTLAEVHPYCT